MRYAILNNSIIYNVVVSDAVFINRYSPTAIRCPLNVGIGHKYVDGVFYSEGISESYINGITSSIMVSNEIIPQW